MDAYLLYKLASCAAARNFYRQKQAQQPAKPFGDVITHEAKAAVLNWFNAGAPLHSLAYTVIKHGEISTYIDRLMRTPTGYNLSKLLFTAHISAMAIKELSLQVWLLAKKDIIVDEIHLYYINPKYVLYGTINYDELIINRNVTHSVISKMHKIDGILRLIAVNDEPPSERGSQCLSLQRCQYAHICFQNVEDYSVLNVAYMSSDTKYNLLGSGITKTTDIPQNLLTPYQQIQIECDRTQTPHIEREKIQHFLKQMKFPIYFLDFEAINYAVPTFERQRAFEPLPFLFSLHILSAPNAALTHHEYLSAPSEDPRRAIADRLCELIGEDGSVVAYGAAFERMVLRSFAELFADLKPKLELIIANMTDMMTVFEHRWFYDPKMRGSHSLKSVAPALDPSAKYDMAVKNGMDAINSYLALSDAPKAEREQTESALKEYCRQDTRSLALIYQRLTQMVID
ncbi:hypothetical protein FACS1894103_5070 [Campylobacterota bacterium]|nr:hypothetical protein FACS1894103_5070 [Campylobacterota bacterium]